MSAEQQIFDSFSSSRDDDGSFTPCASNIHSGIPLVKKKKRKKSRGALDEARKRCLSVLNNQSIKDSGDSSRKDTRVVYVQYCIKQF